MPFIKPKNFVAAKLETTYGTAITVAAADFNVRIFDVSVDPEIEMYMNSFASGRHSMGQATPGKKKCHIKFKVNMQCGSALGTAPTMGKFFKACGTDWLMILKYPPPDNFLNFTNAKSGSTPVVSQSITKPMVPVGAITVVCAFL